MSAQPESFSSGNLILNALSDEDLERLRPHLELVELAQGRILYDIEEEIRYVYFPNNAMVSVVNIAEEGVQTEVGVIGREGFSGIEGLLNGRKAINRQMIQLPGSGYQIKAEILKKELFSETSFQRMTLRLMRALLAQLSQTGLCNRLHKAEQRLAKWLLMCHDRFDGDTLPITQEFAAIMLGANRTSVTIAAGHLQVQGFIKYSRGKITVVDRAGLEAYACECYKKISAEYAALSA